MNNKLKSKRKIILFLIYFFIFAKIFSSSAGTTSIFDIGLNVRLQTLGNSFVAGKNDASLVFFNSAGLYSLNRYEIQAAYIPLFMDTFYNFLVIGIPTLDYGVFGFSFERILTENIITRDNKGQIIGNLNQELLEIITGWGKDFIFSNLFIGFNLKIFYQKIGDINDSAFGMDMGFFYNLISDEKSKLNLGFNIKNLYQPEVKLLLKPAKLPRQFIIGTNYEWQIFKELKTDFYFDFLLSFDTDFEYRTGLEFNLFNVIFLRCGYNSYNYSFGTGFNFFDTFFLDYGVFFIDLDTQHRFSFKFKFGDDFIVLRNEKYKLEIEKIENKAKEIANKELEKLKKQMDDIKKKAAKEEYFKALHYTNALEAYSRGDLKLADVEFNIVYKIDPNYLNIKYYINLIDNLRKDKKETYDKNIIKLYQQGVEKYLKGDYKGAKEEWSKILKIDPYNKLAIDNIREVNEILRSIEKE